MPAECNTCNHLECGMLGESCFLNGDFIDIDIPDGECPDFEESETAAAQRSRDDADDIRIRDYQDNKTD